MLVGSVPAMSVSPPNPHDAFFRQILGRPAHAAAELRAVLPEAIATRLDWNRLELQPGSFVSRELRSRYSDLLFATCLDGRDALIYLLVEHQSSDDRFMALRMLDYLVNIWNQHLRKNTKARTLPAVIPVVVHTNPTGKAWTAATELSELIDLDPAARHALDPYLPRLRFLLDDIAVLDIPTLMQRTLTPAAKIMLTLHKIAPGNTRLGVELMPLVEDLRALLADPGGLEDLQAVVTYILIVGDTTQADLGLVIDRLGPDAREAIMTTAERLRAEGRLEGEAKGLARGRTEGEAKGRAEMLMSFLTAKFGAVPADVAEVVAAGDAADMLAWLRRAFTADSLAEVFGR